MKEIRIKNFRCVEQESGEYRVYFSLHGEERCIGYYKGYLSGNEDIDEQSLTGNPANSEKPISKSIFIYGKKH